MKSKFFYFPIFICFLLSHVIIAQDVNPFTGSLNYGVPVFSVPSNRGNPVPINLSYGANISVLQPASEVGLGWGLEAGGSIVRSVNGIPDDFNGQQVFNQSLKQFVSQRGVLSPSGPTSFDILSSKRNLDSLEFYYPSYDQYNVSGPGMGGTMTPMILNYMAFSRDDQGGFNYDESFSGTYVKPQFIFHGDFADTLISRHYPLSPVDASTPFKMPKDIVTGDCHNDATPYFGKKGNGTGGSCEENYNPTTNRLGTANYIEYFTNAEINSSLPAGFIDYQATHTRTATSDLGAFRITNSAGYIYHYSLPVYSNSTTNYSYPLKNNYGMLDYTSTFSPDVKTVSGNNYFVEHSYPSAGSYVVEVKEANKVAMEWKLTAITGPDFVDANNNNMVDDADKGYWVAFDYKLWNNSFTNRYPAYGFNYFYDLDENTKNHAFDDPSKRSGKFATASVSNNEVYYLNSITTSSHKAVFVREMRQDEVGSNDIYDGGLHDSLTISSTGTVVSHHGSLFDEGGSTGGYTAYPVTNYTKTVQLGNIEKLILNFKEFYMDKTSHCTPACNWKYDNLHIYAGPNDTYPEISFTYTSTTFTSPFNTSPYNNPPVVPLNVDITISNYTATAITFKIEKFGLSSGTAGIGNYNIEWHAVGKRTPQLGVKRILLFNKDYSIPATTSLTPINTSFDLSNTTNASAPLYNETWYQANKTNLDNNILKGYTLEYDYSLANKYHRNINCTDYYRNTRLSSPTQVQQNLAINTSTLGTGKLTLKKVITTGFGNAQIVPSVKFDYNATVTNDNPEYDPRKIDNWGYYKSDVSSLGYYSYTTNTSKDYTDAWSLRKITSPLGGITEIEYESNNYTKVIKGNGGFRGPIRIYPIDSLSSVSPETIPLKIYLEEGANLPEDLSTVYNSTASATYSTDFFIPLIQVPSFPTDPNGIITNCFGNFTYTYTGTPLPIIPRSIQYASDATIGNPNFKTCSSGSMYYDANSNIIATLGYKYTGNGWVRFTMPVGTNTVYGGGSRVKKITTKNGTTDAYTALYEYEGGVALNETDRFTNPVYRYGSHASCAVPNKLQSFGADGFDLSSTIGYSKVKIKNLGQVNAAKGWSEYYFNTSDSQSDAFVGNYIDNFKVNISDKSTFTSTTTISSTTCSRTDTGFVVEYVDKFSPYWGLTKEDRVYDAASNILSRNIYEYESTTQGALVENFVFALVQKYYYWNPDWGYPAPCNFFNNTPTLYQTCIKHQYPAVLKKTTSYGMGTKTISETLKRDEVTGEGIISQTSSDNKTSALSIKTPAFRISTFAAMGPKSVNSTWSNNLGSDAMHYSVVDSSLTVATGSVSTNFSGITTNAFTKTALVRSYNSGTNTYTNTSTTLPNWYNHVSFGWIGTVGSLDTYGLYKKSELTSNPFNFSSPFSSNSKWRLIDEITLMDDKGHTLETRNFNNKFTATKLNYDGKYLHAQATNCNYKSFTFTSFETNNGSGMTDGEVNMPSAVCTATYLPTIYSHTGAKVAKVFTTGMGPNYSVAYEGTGTYGEELGLLRDRIYRASVWTHTVSATGANLVINLNGSTGGTPYNKTVTMNITDAKAVTIGEWKLLYVDIKVPYNYVSSGGSGGSNKLLAYLEVQGAGTAYFDDFQLHPIESSTSAKVYDPINGLILADISAEGYATKYSYDAAGRLISIFKEIPGVGLKLIKSTSYNYARGLD